MSESPDGYFSCTACQKTYAWKPEWAGRTAQCTCGQPITVPARAPDINDLYDFALPAGNVPLPVIRQTVVATAPIAAVTHGPPTLGYRSAALEREADQKLAGVLHSPGRDRIAPAVLLIVGFLLYCGWIVQYARLNPVGFAVASLILAAFVLAKTAVLLGAAFFIANVFGAYFGTLWTAVLKLSAIVIFTDCSFLWIDQWVAAIPGIGGAGVRLIGLIFFLEAAVIAVQAYLLFEIDTDDVLKIGACLAIGSRLVDIVVMIVFS